MSEMKHEQGSPETRETAPKPSGKLAIPFFAVLAILTLVAFIIPLRPTVSYSEKRELTKFPEFTVEALLSGDYFDDITLWFSDTFPGREQWMTISRHTEALHGYSEIAIVEDNFLEEIMNPVEQSTEPTPPPTTLPPVTDPSQPADETQPTETTSEPETEPTETIPEETEWGGVDAGDNAEITMGAVIQIGDSAFNQLGYSEYASKRYAAAISKLADALADKNVTVVSAPPPIAVGVMIEPEYLEKLRCARQDEMLYFIHGQMSENVVTVDTFQALVTRNSEYIYFRTDHHWTALGAYYSYAAICKELGIDAAPLDAFEVVDYGEFRGSLTEKAPYPTKLRSDTLIAYRPAGEITVHNVYEYGKYETDLLHSMENRRVYEKYLAFLGGDYALQEIVNESLPEGSVCVVVKDSFGNCFAPFLTQNYHTVYVMDYRKYRTMTLQQFVEAYDVDTVIMMPYLMATQSTDAASMFEGMCR
jgi:hypothetical protein